MTIIEKMHDTYQAMTPAGQMIYHYLLQNALAFSLKPIGEVASTLGISQMTLVRFAQSLGFDGYSDFKKQLQSEEILKSNPAERLAKIKISNQDTSMSELFKQEIANIEDSYSNNDVTQILKFVDDLMGAEKIYIYGAREQYLLAQILRYRLYALGFNVEQVNQNYINPIEHLYISKANSIHIFFDYYPYIESFQTSAIGIKDTKSKIALISDYPACPIAEYSDYSFYHPSKTDYFMNSLSGPLFWINLTLTQVMENMGEEFAELLVKKEVYKANGIRRNE